MLVNIAIVLLCALGFRIRGGLGERWGWKFPLNKYWFALIFSACDAWLNGWDLNRFAVMFIAARLSTQLAGWGEFVGCVLGKSQPQPDRKDFPKVDDMLDNMNWEAHDVKVDLSDWYFPYKTTIHIPAFNLLDHSILFGWLGLTIRGLYLSFIIGLALQSIPYMLCGAAMGTIYWLCGLFSRKVYPLYKGGWNVSEWLYGAYLGLMLCVLL